MFTRSVGTKHWPVWLRVVDRSLRKMVGADDGVEFSEAETADGTLGPGGNVYGGQRALAWTTPL